MSKNISIQEGGIGKQLTVDKLKTNLVGGGSCLWVPEDSINLGTKSISENGTFRASDDGYLGYSEVTVSGVGTVTGRDPETGEEKQVSVDPETGDLEEKVIPKSIRVTTLPTKVNYNNGETINYSGIAVHAYSSTGRDLGAVAFNELVFPVTKASASGDEWTDGQGLNATMLYYTPHYGVVAGEEKTVYCSRTLGMLGDKETAYGSDDSPGQVLATRYNGNNYGMRITGDGKAEGYAYYPDTGGSRTYGWLRNAGNTVRLSNDRFSIMGLNQLTDLPVSTVNPSLVDPSTLHATQTLPVQWPSADAGTTLETSFTINVTGGGT